MDLHSQKIKKKKKRYTKSTPNSSVQFDSVALLCLTLCNPMDFSMPGFSVHHLLPELTQSHVHWVSDVIQPSHPLPFHFLLPSIFPSIRVFSNESILLIRCPNYWNFNFSTSPSDEYSGLISFRMDWLISPQSKGLLRVFSSITVQKHQIFSAQLSLYSYTHIFYTFIHDYWKDHSLN